MARLVEQSVGERFPELRPQFAIHAQSVCDGIDQDKAPAMARKR